MAIEFNTAHPRDPLLPGGRRLRARRARRAAGVQRVARAPAARGRRGRPARRRRAPTATRTRRASLLRSRLSDRYGVPGSRIALGNGSCDILLAAGQALLEPGAELVYAWPSFSIYPHLAAASGARAVTVPLNDRHEHDLDAMLGEITAATRLVIVCNPNNPTSTALPLERDRARSSSEVPSHVCVILDEAYCEYSTLDDPDASLDLLDDHSNLVLLRTFSKVYGLCRPARRLRAVRVGGLRGRGQPGAPAVLRATSPRRRRRSRPCGTPTRSPSASSARSSPACSSRRASPAWGCRSPTRRRTSSGSTSPRTPTSRRSSAR